MAIADYPFTFASQPIIDPITGQPVLGATGGVLQDPRTQAPLPMADMNGNPITQITGNAYGMSQQFRSTQLAVLVVFGGVYVQAPSIELFDLVQTSVNAVSLATAAQSSAATSASAALAAEVAAEAAEAAAISAAAGGGGAVKSVAGRIGDVTVTKIDVGLGNVDNTTDASKPVSAPQQTALNAKANDNAVAHLAGTNTFTGPNTFTTSPAVPTPVNPTDAANRAFVLANVGTGSGVTDHGALSGLLDDDHPQYHTDTRGDARYFTQAQVTAAINTAVTSSSTADRSRANHSGTQLSSSISDFTAAVQAIAGSGTLADNSVTAAKIVDGTVGLAELSTTVLNAFPRTDVTQALTAGQKTQLRTNAGIPTQLVATVVRTFTQGVPSASEIAALPNPCIVVIQPA